jgi:hypothetical protein
MTGAVQNATGVAFSVALSELAVRINHEHLEAVQHAGSAMTHALNAGDLLLQAKNTCQHGQWLPWIREHVAFSDRTAQAYMRLARNAHIRSTVADMSVREALRHLARPRVKSFEDDLRAWGESCPKERLLERHGPRRHSPAGDGGEGFGRCIARSGGIGLPVIYW